MRQQNVKASAGENSLILNEMEVAALLRIEPRTVRLWRQTRGLPHFKPTQKVVLFHRQEVLEWLNQTRVAVRC